MKPEDRAVLVLLRQVFDSIDAVEQLASNGSVAAADPLLRAALEAFFSLSFIVADPAQMPRRGRAYMLIVLRRQLRDLLSRQAGTPDYEARLKKIQGDKYVSAFVPTPDENEKQEIAAVERELAHEWMAPIGVEFDELRKTEKTAKWYRLGNGPSSVELLAKAVGQSGIYDILYRAWSVSAHAQDVALPTEPAWLRLRSLNGYKVAVSLTIWVGVESLRAAVMFYRPSEWDDMTEWYNTEVRPRREKLQAVEIPDLKPAV